MGRCGSLKTKVLAVIGVLAMLLLTACAGMETRAAAPLAPQERELLTAVLKNDLSATTRLLQAGVSPNGCAANGNSILQTAVYGGNLEMVKLLLRYQADVNFVNVDGLTALYLAKKPAMQRALLENGANPFVRSEKKQYSPLEAWCTTFAHITSEAEKKKALEILKSQHIAVTREQLEQKEWLTRADLAETVKLYQAYKYDINQTANVNKHTPLHIAALEDRYPLMLVLLAAGGRGDVKDRIGDDPLNVITRQRQSQNGNDDYATVVKALVKAGADINGKDGSGNTPLCNAALVGNPARLKTLLGVGGIRVNEPGEFGESALFKSNVPAVARELVAAKANVNQTNNGGSTPLFTVTNPEVVAFLIKSGANVNHLNDEKRNILVHNLLAAHGEYKISMDETAVTNRYLKKFELLIRAGIRVNDAPTPNLTALQLANRVPFTKIVELLRKAGAR
ncbi:MAG: ankyrin repeat domain-containing protein [Deltaproteobacteria bacterium]|nr:ankyrin repeat domain-containing protein [Deltaproteobacteria bacterium]